MVEYCAFNTGVLGSNPDASTKAGMAEMAYASDLESEF